MAYHKPWIAEEEQLLRSLHADHAAIEDMATQLNRQVSAIRQKITHMKLGPIAEKYWRADEIERLQELWGQKTIPQIAKILGRSVHAVKVKSTRLQLGAFKHSSEYLTSNQVAVLLGVDIHAVTNLWISKLGLKYKSVSPRGTQTFKYIKQTALLDWLRDHQDAWDSRRLEKHALGLEPDWLKEKRKLDAQAPVKRLQKWTQEDDKRLISLFKPGTRNHQQIGEILGRSASAVEHRLMRLDVWGTGKFVGETHKESRRVKRQAKTRQDFIVRLRDALLYQRNKLAFDGYWQKEMCQLWDDIEGCTAGEADCDTCVSFLRIQPQYCRRCGSTVISRKPLPSRICERCRKQRKAQYFRKMNALGRGPGRTDENEAV